MHARVCTNLAHLLCTFQGSTLISYMHVQLSCDLYSSVRIFLPFVCLPNNFSAAVKDHICVVNKHLSHQTKKRW